MNEKHYDVTIIEDKQVDYEATIDQTARFDGLYPGMPWPANHGEGDANQDGRKLHGRKIHVIEELITSALMTWVRFSYQGKLVWIQKDGIIPPLQQASVTGTSYMAVVKNDQNYPLFSEPPYTTPHAHIPSEFTQSSHLDGRSVNILAEAQLVNGNTYANFIDHSQSLWIRKSLLNHQGLPLPLIRIEQNLGQLSETGKHIFSVSINYPSGKTIQTFAKIDYQGNFTKQFPRKNLEISFYSDLALQHPQKVAFGDWQPRQKYSLRSDYYDQTHVRNTTGFQLWRELLASEDHYRKTIRDSEMLGTIQGTPIVLNIDGVNDGIYTLFSYFDANSLRMNSKNNEEILLFALNGEIGGKYLAFSNSFAYLNDTDFHVMSNQYPSNKSLKNNVNRLMNFINESTDSEFRANARNYFDPLNLIDYLLFIGVLNAYDNEAHNMSAFTYDGQQWLFSLLDLDISFNIEARGALLTRNEPLLKNIQAPLLKRIVNCFPDEVKKRWSQLRLEIFSEKHIISIYKKAIDTIESNNYINDQLIWQSPTGATSSLKNASKFIEAQLPKCDTIIKKL